MKVLRRAVMPLFLVMLTCAVSVYFYAIGEGAVLTGVNAKDLKTVIIDAGHPALKNTKNTIDFKKIIKHRPRKCTNKLSGE